MKIFVGDLHMHTTYSDGQRSPIDLMLQAMYCNLDFAVITDHNTIKGALFAEKALNRNGFAFPCIVGEEISTDFAHFNGYPLKELVPWDIPFPQIVTAVHHQNGVIQVNHPGGKSDWSQNIVRNGITGTGLDAWEHMPMKYEQWKKAGTLPIMTGTSDTESGFLTTTEKTIILAPTPTGPDLADAIRNKRVAAYFPGSHLPFYGPDPIVTKIYQALAEGKMLKTEKIQRIKTTLRRANLAELLKTTEHPPSP
jgi:hypothetical protein